MEEGFGERGACYQDMIFPGEMNAIIAVVVVIFFFAMGNLNFADYIRIVIIDDAIIGIIVTKDKSTIGDELQTFGVGCGGGLDEERSSLMCQ